MSAQKSGRRALSSARRRWAAALLSIALIAAIFLLAFRMEKAAAKAWSRQHLEALKVTCQKYDDYRLGSGTEDLQALINKANILSLYTGSEALFDEASLRRYAQAQYLSGIVVLDDALAEVGSVDLDGRDSRPLLELALEDSNARSILEHPEKVFAQHAELGGRNYDYAMVARQDAPGVIVCYSDTTQFQSDKYELSLNTLLNYDSLKDGAIVVVTDGRKILSTNAKRIQGLSVAECPITNVSVSDLLTSEPDLIQLRIGGNSWYGMHDVCRDYYLYVFYPGRVLQMYAAQWTAAAVGVCAAALLLVRAYRQRQKQRELAQMEKEYHLVNAIASIYSNNLLIHLQEDRWEPILETPRMEQIVGGAVSARQMIENICENGVSPDSREEFRAFADLDTAPRRLFGKPFIGYTFEDVNGRWFQSLLIPQCRNRDDEVTAVMLLLRNVTEQKQREIVSQERLRQAAEEAAAANAAKTDFLRRMSHDLRTPINGIRGMAEIGRRSPDNSAETNACFDKILGASGFLLELVNNVLDMSKLEAGEAQWESRPFDLRDLLRSAVTVIESQAAELNVRVTLEPFEGEHWRLIGSPLNVQRIFQNIMSNAVKYNRPGGSVRIRCREECCDGEKATFAFVCEDTGVGMSEEFQKHAFDTFAQEEGGARTRYPGSGLGLPIAQKTAEYLGGSIRFVSEKGKGTVFTVELPLKLNPEPAADAPEESDADVSLSGMRLLLAEDNALNREIAETMLREKGAETVCASDGAEAVEAFRASAPGEFDAILMDIQMPTMDGLEAAKCIRAMERPDARSVPIFAMTANAFADDVAMSRAAGMNEHLSKPLDFQKVAALICRYCRKK